MTRQWRLFEKCWPFVVLYLAVFEWKVQRFCWPIGTSLECVESIYVKTTETACVSDELCRFKEEEDVRFSYKRVRGRSAILKVRGVDMEYS